MILVVTLLLLVAVLLFVGYPLVRPASSIESEVLLPAAEQREQLLAEREQALSALKDLEFERSVGNLSERDYALLHSAHRHKAVAILRELDQFDATSEASPAANMDMDAAILDARLEEEIARARQRLGATGTFQAPADALPQVTCPACNAPNVEGGTTCARCGTSFEEAREP